MVEYYAAHARRELPWRVPAADGSFSPYEIMVSELMLQQTQVARVVPKYQAFIARFPDATSLAAAPLSDVLTLWIGLGYNRRVRYLWEAARALAVKPEPWTYDDLVACKGIGPNTAAAIEVYSYNTQRLFIETNIRTVILHHFFADKTEVTDKDILTALERLTPDFSQHPPDTPLGSPRLWYWALMDYGSHLKRTMGNSAARSKAYVKQSRFAGSRRQLRGKILRLLSEQTYTKTELAKVTNDDRFDDVLEILIREKLVMLQDNTLMLYNESDDSITN